MDRGIGLDDPVLEETFNNIESWLKTDDNEHEEILKSLLEERYVSRIKDDFEIENYMKVLDDERFDSDINNDVIADKDLNTIRTALNIYSSYVSIRDGNDLFEHYEKNANSLGTLKNNINLQNIRTSGFITVNEAGNKVTVNSLDYGDLKIQSSTMIWLLR